MTRACSACSCNYKLHRSCEVEGCVASVQTSHVTCLYLIVPVCCCCLPLSVLSSMLYVSLCYNCVMWMLMTCVVMKFRLETWQLMSRSTPRISHSSIFSSRQTLYSDYVCVNHWHWMWRWQYRFSRLDSLAFVSITLYTGGDETKLPAFHCFSCWPVVVPGRLRSAVRCVHFGSRPTFWCDYFDCRADCELQWQCLL